jgi:hypothetical protein
MKISSITKLFALFCLVTALPANAFAADTNPPPRLTVELRDGSRVVGQSAEKYFKFHSALLGDFKLDVKDVRSVEFVSTNSARLTTANGDMLTVAFANTDFAVKTGFGKVALAADSVRRLAVVPGFSGGNAREGLVLFWAGNGDTKNNVGTDSDTPGDLRSGTVMVANKPALVSMQQTRQFTFEAWIKPNSIPREFPVLLSKGGNQPPNAYGGYELYLNANGDNDIGFVSGRRGLSTIGANGHWVNQHLGEWIYVVFTLDDRTRSAKFYVNGQRTNDEDNNGTESDINFNVPNNLYIGSPDPASHPNRARFDGEMRNVTLFNRALTPEEIQADFQAGHPD